MRTIAPILLLLALADGAYLVMEERSGAPGDTVSESSGAFQVVDGDTVRFNGERLRLLVIDAPKISSPRCPAEYQAGVVAKNELSDFLFRRPITVHYSGRRISLSGPSSGSRSKSKMPASICSR